MSIHRHRPNRKRVEALHADIRVRIGIQNDMAPHTQHAIEMELGVSTKTVYRIENDECGECNPFRIRPALVAEIRRRRQIYHQSKTRLEAEYSVRALSERHQLSGRTIENHIRTVKDQMIAEARQKAVA